MISINGLRFIAHWEGVKFSPYLCPAGKWTIGVGHVLTPAQHATFLERQALPEEVASFLRGDTRLAMRVIDLWVAPPLTQYQRDALISLVFNIGPHAFRHSTLLRVLNAGGSPGRQWERWKYAGDVILPGLVNRRAAEIKLFNEGDYGDLSTEEELLIFESDRG